jgi:formylglycine-generating enzyme required for sulfatase activity
MGLWFRVSIRALFNQGFNRAKAFFGRGPKHEVALSAFYLDKRGVMDAEFKRFIDVNPQWRSDRIPPSVITVAT